VTLRQSPFASTVPTCALALRPRITSAPTLGEARQLMFAVTSMGSAWADAA